MTISAINLFATMSGSFSTAAGLTPEEALIHAYNFSNADLLLLSDDALDIVARVRPFVVRLQPRREQAC